jgi:hypothetical protein
MSPRVEELHIPVVRTVRTDKTSLDDANVGARSADIES